MKRHFGWIAFGVAGLLFGAVTFAVKGASVRKNFEIICQDHERFIVNEWEALTTVDTHKHNSDLIVVDKRLIRLTLYRDGKELKRWTVAIGTSETPSPVGEWKIIHKGGTWGGGFGARWMGLNVPWGIYGIHGTDKPGSIGYMSSHGCIRMHNKNVVELYNLVQVGTPVHIIGDLNAVKPRKLYQRGMTGQDLVKLQLTLRKSGFDPGPADARYGSGMEQAVLKMQQFYGLPMNGKLTGNELCLLGLQ